MLHGSIFGYSRLSSLVAVGVAFLALLLATAAVEAQLTTVDWEDCLYVGNLNSKVSVLKPQLDAQNDPIFPPAADLITEVQDVGLYPSGLDIYKNRLYVSSYLNVPVYDIEHEMEADPILFDIDSLYGCLPGGAVRYADIFYIACYDNPTPYSLVKISLADADYGKLLGGVILGGVATNFMTVSEGPFSFVDQLSGNQVNVDGAMVFFTLLNRADQVICFDVAAQPRESNITQVYLFNDMTGAPKQSMATWGGITFYEGSLYGIYQYVANQNGLGQILELNGTTGTFIGNVTEEYQLLFFNFDLIAGPDGLFFTSVATYSFVDAAIDIFVIATGEYLGQFYRPKNITNRIIPQFLRWY
eukprot:TRINITY_DN7366_c0_g1_i1.p1 TRINITY_DN7366_c0_g1~~TRINITY_DN7366_c0_g1_i1.p1  ORF type:complete len:358 (+),score=37.11 TRINITY_DN7366_c0_g1_i1:130-1203(+)